MAYSDYGTIEATYQGHIAIIDGLISSGETNFPLMQANSIWVPRRWDRYINDTYAKPYTTGIRLDKRIQQLEDDKVNREGGDLLIGVYHFNNSIVVGNLFEDIKNPADGCVYASGAALRQYLSVWGNTGESLVAKFNNDGMEIGVPSWFFKNVQMGTDQRVIKVTVNKDLEVISETKTNTLIVEDSATIKGDLIVKGETITEEHTTLTIQDNLLVLNVGKEDDSIYGSEETGIVFTLDNLQYGLILDKEGLIKLGPGSLSKGEGTEGQTWTYSNTGVYPLAIRDLTDDNHGQLLEWDKESSHIVSADITVKQIQDEIDADCAQLWLNIRGGRDEKNFAELRDTIIDGCEQETLATLKQHILDTHYDIQETNTVIQNFNQAHGKRTQYIADTDITISMKPNVEYKCSSFIKSFNISDFVTYIDSYDDTNFSNNCYSIIFTIDPNTGTSDEIFPYDVPDKVMWAGIAPQFVAGHTYKLSFNSYAYAGNEKILGEWVVYN